MDEPLSNLDAALRVQARAEIKRLQSEVGTTTVYVTHDQVEAMTLGDRIAVMNEGGSSRSGRRRSSTSARERVRRRLHRQPTDELPAARRALLGVRPEHVRLWDDGLLGPIDGRVAYVEALGRETLVGIDTDAGARLVTVEGRARVEVGERLRLGLVEAGVRRF